MASIAETDSNSPSGEHPQLRQAIADALEASTAGFATDRKRVLTRAQANLKEAMETVTLPAQPLRT